MHTRNIFIVPVGGFRARFIDSQSMYRLPGTYTHKPFKVLLLLISELKHDSIQFPMNKRIFVFVSSFFCQLFCSFARSKNGDFRVENFKLIAFKAAFITI